ncbi:6-carboxyhexanoate--CoA ligase [Bacillus ectoiniformans]|uniref:6-carboxyhexanoate--CoA ligase n=1 Tax=Bacillus ectoiniformans TaxID=1494429 RepID=UPI0019577D84|nr:6-carboxyhexanoate--CoA ligase [Bacillus ectoiniformans]MBM7647362.1 6-carboxyhexanoate--CoA ligase [Bacillus ectoiniformans]
MYNDRYSIRMRSAEGGAHEAGGMHISGAERIVAKEQLEEEAQKLVKRAMIHERGQADFIQITIEKIDTSLIEYVPALIPKTVDCRDVAESRNRAQEYLLKSGVAQLAANMAVSLLANAEDFPGAYLLDAETGKILNPFNKAIRVSQIDWDERNFSEWSKTHAVHSLSRIREAVALASKTAASPFIAAELCWSDDPGYLTGYVASQSVGYIRLTPLKEKNCYSGGRVFFVKGEANIDQLIHYLTKVPVMVTKEVSEIV